jgi:[ribosomal protein S5]-alanine N-acetyltransferase
MTFRIQTSIPDCTLRQWTNGDKSDLIANGDNANIWRNLTDMFPHPYTQSDAESWIAFANQEGGDKHLAIDVAGKAVGGIGVIGGQGISRRTAQFGYWIGEAYWGKGIATASASAALSHFCENADFVRFEACVFEWNPASMNVLEKVGFQREGILRKSISKDGQVIDGVMYSYVI